MAAGFRESWPQYFVSCLDLEYSHSTILCLLDENPVLTFIIIHFVSERHTIQRPASLQLKYTALHRATMPDPLTVISSLSAIITVKEATTKTVTTLIDLRHTWKDSDLIFLAFSSQLTALRAALDQIQEWMERGDGRAHHQLIMDLDVSLSCCKLLVSRIDDFIFQLDRSTDTPLDVAGKAKVVLGVRGLDEAQKLLERQIQALTLLLTACNW